MVSLKTLLSTAMLACVMPTSAQEIIRQKVTIAEAAETLSITEAQAEALLTDPTQTSFKNSDLIAMLGVNASTMEQMDTLNFDKRVIATAADTITRYLDIPVASQKRDPSNLELEMHLLVVRQQFEDALHESQVLLQNNQTTSLDEAAGQHSTVCAGKGSKCTLCFVGSSMIYLGASTVCALAAVGVAGASAGALTPAAIAGYSACMLGTTGTLLNTLPGCGN